MIALTTGRDVRPKIEVAYLSTKFILMDREKNIKLNGKNTFLFLQEINGNIIF